MSLSRSIRFSPRSFVPILLALATPALAAPFTMNGQTYDVQFVTGAGDAKAILDFQPDPSHQFLFGYQFTGPSVSSADLLAAIAANSNGAFTADTSLFGPDFVAAVDYTLNGVTFGNPAYTYDDDTHTYDYPIHFTSSDGLAWSPSQVGASEQSILANTFDGWLVTTLPWTNIDPPESPTPVGAAVPEPASLALLSLASLTLLKRKHRH